MGTDKATLVVNGLPMAQRLVNVLGEVGIANIALAGSPELPDEAERYEGPMSGIVSGWRHLRAKHGTGADPVVVLSCDLPHLGADAITALVDAANLHRHGAAAHDGDQLQPLIAAYRPEALDEIERAFTDGERSVRRCFLSWDLGQVDLPHEELVDADTPQDLDGHEVSWPVDSLDPGSGQ